MGVEKRSFLRFGRVPARISSCVQGNVCTSSVPLVLSRFYRARIGRSSGALAPALSDKAFVSPAVGATRPHRNEDLNYHQGGSPRHRCAVSKNVSTLTGDHLLAEPLCPGARPAKSSQREPGEGCHFDTASPLPSVVVQAFVVNYWTLSSSWTCTACLARPAAASIAANISRPSSKDRRSSRIGR